MWSPWAWVSTISDASSSFRPAAAIAAGSSCWRLTSIRAKGTFRADAVSPASTSRSPPPCSMAQPRIGRGSEKAPGMNRSSWRRGPKLGNRKLCLTRTAPVVRAWIRIQALLRPPSRFGLDRRLAGDGRGDSRVLEHGHRRISPIEGDHRSGGVRCRAAEVEALHRRARFEPPIPHLIRERLALEDVAPGEADALLDVRRAEDLGLDHAVAKIGRIGLDQLEGRLADLIPARVPVAVGELVRRVLGEDAHHMGTRRGDRGV